MVNILKRIQKSQWYCKIVFMSYIIFVIAILWYFYVTKFPQICNVLKLPTNDKYATATPLCPCSQRKLLATCKIKQMLSKTEIHRNSACLGELSTVCSACDES